MTWYQEILYLFIHLGDTTFRRIISEGTWRKSVVALVVSTALLQCAAYGMPLAAQRLLSLMSTRDMMTGLPSFDHTTVLIDILCIGIQIVVGGFALWRLSALIGGTGTFTAVTRLYTYALAYTNTLRAIMLAVIHIVGVILYTVGWGRHFETVGYIISVFTNYYAVFIGAQLIRRYVNLGIVKMYILLFIITWVFFSVNHSVHLWMYKILTS